MYIKKLWLDQEVLTSRPPKNRPLRSTNAKTKEEIQEQYLYSIEMATFDYNYDDSIATFDCRFDSFEFEEYTNSLLCWHTIPLHYLHLQYDLYNLTFGLF